MRRWVALAAIAVLAVGCDKKDGGEVKLAPTASALASSAPPPTAKVVKYTFDTKSKTSIDMVAPKERIKAFTEGGSGELQIDLMNFTNTRGEAKADLKSITMTHWPDAKDNASQSEHARTWLEVADKLPDDVKTPNRWAVFAIRGIEGVSEPNVTKIPVTKDGADDVRIVTCKAKGEFLVHGHKVDKELELELKLRYAPGAKPDDKPTSIDVKTTKPFEVTLAEHDVKPRDDFGKIAKGAFNLLGTKVGEVANVSLEFRATPAP